MAGALGRHASEYSLSQRALLDQFGFELRPDIIHYF
jgi:hypothetical protein